MNPIKSFYIYNLTSKTLCTVTARKNLKFRGSIHLDFHTSTKKNLKMNYIVTFYSCSVDDAAVKKETLFFLISKHGRTDSSPDFISKQRR